MRNKQSKFLQQMMRQNLKSKKTGRELKREFQRQQKKDLKSNKPAQSYNQFLQNKFAGSKPKIDTLVDKFKNVQPRPAKPATQPTTPVVQPTTTPVVQQPDDIHTVKEINDSLDFAKNNFPRGATRGSALLEAAIKTSLGMDPQTKIKKDKDGNFPENDYFKIDDEYDPSKPWTLLNHIEFKKPFPEGSLEDKYLDIFMNSEFGNEEANEKWKQQMAHQGFGENIKDFLDKHPDGVSILAELENIMNSSHIWRILNAWYDDSEQRKTAWTNMTTRVSYAIKNSNDDAALLSDLDELVNSIEQEDDWGTVRDKANDMINNSIHRAYNK